MTLTVALSCVLAQLATFVLAVANGRAPVTMRIVYGASLVTSLTLLGLAADHLLGAKAPVAATLPLGLPWLGAHLRIDVLGAFSHPDQAKTALARGHGLDAESLAVIGDIQFEVFLGESQGYGN